MCCLIFQELCNAEIRPFRNKKVVCDGVSVSHDKLLSHADRNLIAELKKIMKSEKSRCRKMCEPCRLALCCLLPQVACLYECCFACCFESNRRQKMKKAGRKYNKEVRMDSTMYGDIRYFEFDLDSTEPSAYTVNKVVAKHFPMYTYGSVLNYYALSDEDLKSFTAEATILRRQYCCAMVASSFEVERVEAKNAYSIDLSTVIAAVLQCTIGIGGLCFASCCHSGIVRDFKALNPQGVYREENSSIVEYAFTPKKNHFYTFHDPVSSTTAPSTAVIEMKGVVNAMHER